MSKKNNRPIVTGLAVMALFIIAFVLVGLLILRPEPLQWEGQVEAAEVRVSGKVPGRILSFYVKEGENVSKGDTLVKIYSPEIEAKLLQATSAEKAAMAQSRKADKGARKQQIEGAYEQWQRAKVGADIAEKTFNRVKNLFDKGVVAEQKKDEAEANYNASVALSKAAKSQYDLALAGAMQEDRDMAQAMVGKAQGAIEEVEAYLSETALLSPISGEISGIFPKQGELVGTGAPIMNVLDLNDSWVVFHIREDRLSEITKGSKFIGTVPALGNKEIELEVAGIKALGSYATWKATKMSGEFDLRSFEIKARPVEFVENLRPGMSVRAKMNFNVKK
ncbi:MAG: efflux RND transporter periplasmic adaptor subunit [Prevotellaceae bacterium]|jgi:HlyD family secretion protein|nr:efflux RND transporter periplasmic adaptor subunit [Prevotellaceae bacterium]